MMINKLRSARILSRGPSVFVPRPPMIKNNAMILYKELTDKILRAAYTVHNELGCGFLEKVYQEALAIKMSEMDIPFEREKRIAISYHGHQLACDYIADFVVDDKVILELKAVSALEKIHEAQLINYLKATGIKVGFLMNFGTLKLDFKRMARY